MAKIATIVFRNGDGTETRSPTATSTDVIYKFVGYEPLAVPLDFPEEIMAIAAAHGIKQKLSDAYADCKGDVAMARAAVEVLVDRLQAGEWNVHQGEGVGRESLLAHAVAEVTGQALPDVIAKLQGKSKEEKAALRKHAQVAPIIARMEAERAQAKAEALATVAADGPALEL